MATVNISKRAAGMGLREDLEKEAAAWGQRIRPFVGRIYEYALANKRSFIARLAEPRDKGGTEIPGTVGGDTARRLTEWATSRRTTRPYHCCYILEKTLEDGLAVRIFGRSTPTTP